LTAEGSGWQWKWKRRKQTKRRRSVVTCARGLRRGITLILAAGRDCATHDFAAYA
jgi:hypothetical protein